MKKVEILSKLEAAGVIAVVRGKNKDEAIKAINSIIAGGIKGIELTFTVPNAEEIIKEIAKKYADQKDVIIGAGTVLDAFTARIAIMAGAEYIVSPSFDRQTAEICNLYQIPYLPGCMTITEIKEALTAGVD
ncbi:bifunctional 2-keto-4-hydroxyglutarate aldolase/2-keto-3-deoxy-6-phosphogluconate aldolase, partial [Enterococcus faecium]|nr:bifunctional 2-keto-4-hydroxyglutarate aldolase/2-keto-3-deoxy-6-phosphogluconate aldolase [Enterococcus faecium]